MKALISLLVIIGLVGCSKEDFDFKPHIAQKTLNDLASNVCQHITQLTLTGGIGDAKENTKVNGKVPTANPNEQVAQVALRWFKDSETLLRLGVEWKYINVAQFEAAMKELNELKDYDWYVYGGVTTPKFHSKEQAKKAKETEEKREKIIGSK